MRVTVDVEVVSDDINKFSWDIIEIFKKYGLDPTKLPHKQWENFYNELLKYVEEACKLEVYGWPC